jgi:hypothetical protein
MNRIVTEVQTVTPLMAAKWLDQTNTKNRRLSDPRVSNLAKEITSGNWHFNHQGIAFYSNGVLADGQHRLAAIVRADTPIKILVTKGLPVASGLGIDNHRPRSVGDIIKVAELSDWIGPAEVKVIRAMYGVVSKTTITLPPTEMVRLGELAREDIQFALSAIKGTKKVVTKPPVKAAMAFAYRYENHDRLREFGEIMVTGMPKSKADAVAIVLRENLLSDPLAGGFGGAVSQRQVCLKTMRAIKAFCSGEHLTRMHQQTEMAYKIDGFSRIGQVPLL